MRAYLAVVLGIAAVGLAAVALIVRAIDPFWIYASPRFAGLNLFKPALATHQRIFKSVNVRRNDWQGLILGTSRAEIGFDPAHPFFGSRRTFNAGMGSQTLEETFRLFEAAQARGGLRQVLLVLDFPVFNAYLENVSSYTSRNFAPWRPFQLLFGIDSLAQSLGTIRGQRGQGPEESVWEWQEDGRVVFTPMVDVHALAIESERGYMEHDLFPPPLRRFALHASGREPMEFVSKLLARAHADRIAVTLVLAPAHARHWEVMAALGLWSTVEAWKRELVALNEREARRAGAPPFPLWDFNDYGPMTTERYPRVGDRGTLRWFSDSSHFTPEAGERVLTRMLEGPDQPPGPEGGSLLTSANLDAWLARTRAGRATWAASNPADAGEIRSMASEAARRRLPPRP